MLAILVIGGILAAAPAWGPFFLSDDVAFFTAPILGVVVAAPAFAALCLLVRCRYCRYRLLVKSQRRWIIEAPMHSMVSKSRRFRGW